MVRAAVLLLCPLYVSVFCFSFFYAYGGELVLDTKPGAVRLVLLRGSSDRSCFWKCRQQGMEGGEGGDAGSSGRNAAAVLSDSSSAMGSFCPWQADGYLLSIYVWLHRFFHCAGNHGAKLGEPLYAGRLFRVWCRIVYKSYFFQPLRADLLFLAV